MLHGMEASTVQSKDPTAKHSSIIPFSKLDIHFEIQNQSKSFIDLI